MSRVTRLVEVLRFYAVVQLVPPPMRLGFLVCALVGCASIVVDPTLASRAVAPVLLLQLFASASGFMIPARRGHYDLLLTSGAGRFSIAVAHWVTSAWPGIATCAALALAERMVGGRVLSSSGTLAAACLASTIPWCLTVPLPRLSGGIVIVLVMVSAAATGGEMLPGIGELAPWMLVGEQLPRTTALVVFSCAMASMAVATAVILHADFPLESSQ